MDNHRVSSCRLVSHMLGSALFLLFDYGLTCGAVYSPEREHAPLSPRQSSIFISALPHAKPSGEFGDRVRNAQCHRLSPPMESTHLPGCFDVSSITHRSCNIETSHNARVIVLHAEEDSPNIDIRVL